MEVLGTIFQLLGTVFSSLLTIFFSILAGFIGASVALFKGRSPILWGLICLIFPWALLIIFILPRKYSSFERTMYNKPQFKGRNPVISSLIGLTAIVAKADGAISKNEINIIRDFITKSFRISTEELDEYDEIFDYAKNHPEEYREYTNVIMTYYRQRDIIMAIAYLLVSVGMADGSFSDKENQQIWLILQELGVNVYEYESIKRAFTSGSSSSQYGFESDTNKKERYAKVLDIDPDASMSDIKKAYRKKAKDYHPDTIASKGMSQDYVKYSNEKLAEINEAYDYFKGLAIA